MDKVPPIRPSDEVERALWARVYASEYDVMRHTPNCPDWSAREHACSRADEAVSELRRRVTT